MQQTIRFLSMKNVRRLLGNRLYVIKYITCRINQIIEQKQLKRDETPFIESDPFFMVIRM